MQVLLQTLKINQPELALCKRELIKKGFFMKQLITKSDGTPTKSKVFAIKFLQDKGISEDCLIQENGQFFYEEGVNKKELAPSLNPSPVEREALMSVSWDTPVYDKNNQKTVLIIPGTDIKATINAKHPGGQIRPTSAFEIAIGQENFIMSLDLVSKLFKVKSALTPNPSPIREGKNREGV